MKHTPNDGSFDRALIAQKTAITEDMTAHIRSTQPELRGMGQYGKKMAREQAIRSTNLRFEKGARITQNQRKIYEAIKDQYDGKDTKEILDIFSGLSLVPLALLADGKAQKIHLVDSHGFNFSRIAEVLRVRKEQIHHIQEMIHPFSDPDILPAVKHVTLIDTGLSLPSQMRAPNTGINYATAKSSHVPDVGLGITFDVLTIALNLLQDVPRSVHIVDTPHEASVYNISKAARERIERVLHTADGDWKIDDMEILDQSNLLSIHLSN